MAEPAHQELVIIRRHGGGHDDAPHGGIWKIAFADFMTAMMAFFLVMWLINASNKETRSAVASYFNPVRLVDSSPMRKGLRDGMDGEGGGANDRAKDVKGADETKGKPIAPKPGDKKPNYTESALFEDPYAVLAEIAAEAARKEAFQPPKADSPQEVVKDSRLVGGEAYRDPFEPIAPTTGHPSLPRPVPPGPQMALAREARPPAPPGERGGQPPQPATPPAEAKPPVDPKAPPPAARAAAPPEDKPTPPVDAAPKKPAPPAKAPPPNDAAQPKEAAAPPQGEPTPPKEGAVPPAPGAAPPAPANAEAAKLAGEIARALGPDAASRAAPKLTVERTAEGILISLTDQFDFGMFTIGSAEPSPKLVQVMAKLGAILKARPGAVVVRGHTDARPFKSATYDNWRLSAARAHMAHYMLVRGGLDEKRIERIEGYAAARPKDPKNPLAAENRRIELLLRDDKS